MKKQLKSFSIAAILAVITFGTTSCNEIISNIDIPYSYDVVYTLPPVPTAGSFSFEADSQHIDIDSILAANGGSGLSLSSASLSSASFDILSPDSANFNFVDFISTAISSPAHAEKIIAYKDSIPDLGVKQIMLDVDNSNFAPVLNDVYFAFKANGSTSEPLLDSTTVRIRLNFNMKFSE